MDRTRWWVNARLSILVRNLADIADPICYAVRYWLWLDTIPRLTRYQIIGLVFRQA